MPLSLLIAILAALAVGGCAGFILGGVMAAGKIADLEASNDFLRGHANSLYSQLKNLRSTIAKFDRDGDGRPGGSLKRTVSLAEMKEDGFNPQGEA